MNDSKAVRITKITVGAVLLVPLLYLVCLGIVSGSVIFALGAAAVAIFPAAILWEGVSGTVPDSAPAADTDDDEGLFGDDYSRYGFSRYWRNPIPGTVEYDMMYGTRYGSPIDRLDDR